MLKFKNLIEEIFVGVRDYYEISQAGEIMFKLCDLDDHKSPISVLISFEKLEKLSSLLGTKNITVSPWKSLDGELALDIDCNDIPSNKWSNEDITCKVHTQEVYKNFSKFKGEFGDGA